MSSHDPYHDLPNLTGQQASALDETRGADPQRFFPSLRGGTTDAITGRILDVPRASVYRSTNQSIPNNVQTTIVWDVMEYDTDGMWNPATPTRLTGRAPGVYLFAAGGLWVASGAINDRQLLLVKTNAVTTATTSYPQSLINSIAANFTGHATAWPIWLNAGDFVEVRVTQISGAALNFGSATAAVRNNAFEACLLSAFGSDSQ